MASILLQWVNNEIGLSAHVSNFEEAFQNGFLFGEILYRHNQYRNLKDFVNTRTADSKIRNFVLIEPTLRRLGIPLSPRNAFEIMSAHRGSALQLLYKIKVVVDKLKSLPRVGQRIIDGVLPLCNVAEKVSRPSFDKKNSALFESTVRNLVENENNIMMERHLEKYTARQTMLLQRAEEAKTAEHQAELHRIDMIRQAGRDKLEAAKMLQSVVQSDEVWKNNLKTRSKDLQRKSDFLSKTNAKHIALRTAKHDLIRKQTLDDLDSFDARLASVSTGKASPKSLKSIKSLGQRANNKADDEPASSTDTDMNISRSDGPEDATSFEQRLASQILSTNEQRKEAQTYLDTLTAKKGKISAARQERARRRRQFLTDKLDARALEVNSSLEQETIARAVRTACVEQSIANDTRIVRSFKDVLMENRAYREETYAVRREHDLELKTLRQNGALEAHVNSFELDVFQSKLQYSDRIEWEQSKAHDDVISYCTDLVYGIVDVTLEVAQYRHLHFGDYRPKPTALTKLAVPLPVMRNMLLAFHDKQACQQKHSKDDSTMKVTADDSNAKIQSWAEYIDYLHGRNNWEELETIDSSNDDDEQKSEEQAPDVASSKNEETDQVPTGPTATSDTLAEIAQIITEFADPLPPKPELPKYLQFSLQICLLGKRCAGKTRLAKKVMQQFNLQIINLEELVAVAAGIVDDVHNAIVDPALTNDVRATLEAGLDVDDELAVRLIMNAVQNVDTDKGGWILDGWPTTLAQAQRLHKELTGYSLEVAAAETPTARGSKMLPPPLAVESPAPPKLFDLVIRLDNELEVLLRRGLGERQDALRSTTFHLDDTLDPRAGLQVPIGADSKDAVFRLQLPNQLVPQSHAAADLAAIEDWHAVALAWWYNHFDIFEAIETAGLSENSIFEDMLKPRCSAVVESKAEQAKAKEQQLLQRKQIEAHDQLLRDFAHIKGRYDAERPLTPTPEEIAHIEELTEAAAKKGKQPKLPPPRTERLELVVTSEGVAILPLQGAAAAAAAVEAEEVANAREAAREAARAEASQDENLDVDAVVEKAASQISDPPDTRKRVKLARFGRDVLVLPDKTRMSMTFEPEPEEGSEEAEARAAAIAVAAALGQTADPPPLQPVATITRDTDNITFTRIPEVEKESVPPAPLNSIDDVRTIVESIRPENVTLLHMELQAIETQFESTLRSSFEGITSSRADSARQLQNQRASYVSFLQRRDRTQNVVDEALQAFNSIPNDMRFDKDTKCELHQRVSDAVKTLVTTVEARRAENAAELENIRESGFLQNRLTILQAHLCELVQAELERCHGVRQLLADLFTLRCFNRLAEVEEEEEGIDSNGLGTVNLLRTLGTEANALAAATESAGGKKKADKKDKKSGKKGNKKGVEEEKPSPSEELDACVAQAEEALENLREDLLLSKVEAVASDADVDDDIIMTSLESAVLTRELDATGQRIRRIGRIGATLCAELNDDIEKIYSALELHANERVAHESAIAQTLDHRLRSLIEEEKVVEFDLEIEHVRPTEPELMRTGQNGLVRIVETRDVRLLPPPQPEPTRNVQCIDDIVCSRKQLISLAHAFHAASEAMCPDASPAIAGVDSDISALQTSIIPKAIVAHVLQTQITRGQAPVGWKVDPPGQAESPWNIALQAFVLSRDNSAGFDAGVGEVVDWRTVLMSLWEASLLAEGRGGALGSGTSDKEIATRIQRLNLTLQTFRKTDTTGSGIVSRAVVAKLPRSSFWFSQGDPDSQVPLEELEDSEIIVEAEIAERHRTALDLAVIGWGNASGGLHYASLLNYASGAGGVPRSVAVAGAIAAASKSFGEPDAAKRGSGSKFRKDAQNNPYINVYLTSENLRVVFPTARGLAGEAGTVQKAMRAASAVKISVPKVLQITSSSQSHIVPDLKPYVGSMESDKMPVQEELNNHDDNVDQKTN